MYRVQATIYKIGQSIKDLNTINEAKALVEHCKNWLKKAHDDTTMRIEITNLETGQIIEAWSNCECKIPLKFLELEKEISNTMKKSRQNGNAAESLRVPHIVNGTHVIFNNKETINAF